MAIDHEISRLASVLPPLALLRDVLMPVLAQVGADWHAGTARIAHEHLMSSTMRNILGSFLRKYSALSGLSEDLLRRTFSFHPVRIGAPDGIGARIVGIVRVANPREVESACASAVADDTVTAQMAVMVQRSRNRLTVPPFW